MFLKPINERLIRYYLSLNRDFRIFVGTDIKRKNVNWQRVESVSSGALVCNSGTLKFRQVTNHLICYPSGEIADFSTNARNLPSGIFGISPNKNLLRTSFDLPQVQFDSELVGIAHSRSRNPKPKYYTTTLRNKGSLGFRIKQFGAYVRNSQNFELSTIIGTEFSAQQFKEWYCQKDDWIAPGQKVSDPNNYGSGDGVCWIYTIETEKGEELFVGSPV